MRSVLAAMTFAIGLLALMSSEASAWYCRAESPSASGWGSDYSRRAASRRALAECAIRTPRRQTCYIVYCR